MTATVLSLAKRPSVRQAELDDALALRFDGTLIVDDSGCLAPHYAQAWQHKADVLGMAVEVSSLTPRQFVALTQLMAVWSFCVRYELGDDLASAAAHDVYIRAVVDGRAAEVELPADLQTALKAIVGSSVGAPVVAPTACNVRPMKLISRNSDTGS